MSQDPFEQLERQLRRAVREQPAPAPGLRARLRARLSLPLLLGVGAICVGGSGALAASQLLPEGPPVEEFEPAPVPNAGAGVVAGTPRLLALRVADPYGGPRWGLRVFETSRGTSCVQFGRVQDGRLGRVVRTGDGPERFRPLKALPGVNALCGGVQRGGFPVLRGLRRVELRGGSGDPRRCSGEPCPIDQARVLRFGLLGPAARTARFVDAEGRTAAEQRLTAAQGGAYLFVQRADPAPFQAADLVQQETARRSAREIERLRAQGVPVAEAMRRAGRVGRAPGRQFSPNQAALLRGDDLVVADFRDGQKLRVAGRGRTKRPLPGVARRRGASPDVRTPLRVEVDGTGARRRFTISFRAPVAVTRADRGYSLTATGPDGSRCTRRIPGGGQATTRDIARGARVVFFGMGARQNTGAGRRTWCPGRFVLRVGYRTPGSGFRGRLVGTHHFVVR